LNAPVADSVLADDVVVIRGRRLDPRRHVDARLLDATYLAALRQELRDAQPFPHLVVSGWFNPQLLELVREEFDLRTPDEWRIFQSEQLYTHRSAPKPRLGPASDIYFGIVNSGWFLEVLAYITGCDDLLADPHLFGGGLHETPQGGVFGIHRDFDVHARHGLSNRMVFITYLNPGWDEAWGACLELWGGQPPQRMRTVPPEFNTSVLLMQGPDSFHGHPQPMCAPPGHTRRSLATYYYQNPQAVTARARRVTTVFLRAHRSKRLRDAAGRWLPPVLLDAIKRLVSR